MAKFTKVHAKKHLPDGTDGQHAMFVATANRSSEAGKSDEDAIKAGKRAAANVKAKEALSVRLADAGLDEVAIQEALTELDELTVQEDSEADPALLETNRARHLAQLGLSEAGSEAADDAARGAYVLASILSIMSDEADESDQMAQLRTGYDAIAAWMQAEQLEIGTPEDEEDPTRPYTSSTTTYQSWESRPTRRGGMGVIALQEAGAALATRPLTELGESALRKDGTIQVKLIDPGWGTSGYYSEAVLKKYGPKAYPAGTKDYWDHPTITEARERPERSLRDLAGELTSDAYYLESGPSGPGLYGDVKVFTSYQEAVDELAPHIGMSITGTGTWHQGKAEGRSGRIIDTLLEGGTCDFVTVAGRGGEIIQLFESYRGKAAPAPTPPTQEDDPLDLKEAQQKLADKDTEIARLREGLVLREAKDEVGTLIESATTKLPDVTKARLREALAANPPVAEDGSLDKAALTTRVKEGIAAEVEYLTKAGGLGRPRGVGGTTGAFGEGDLEEADKAADAELDQAFAAIGLSEAERKIAVGGRTGGRL